MSVVGSQRFHGKEGEREGPKPNPNQASEPKAAEDLYGTVVSRVCQDAVQKEGIWVFPCQTQQRIQNLGQFILSWSLFKSVY